MAVAGRERLAAVGAVEGAVDELEQIVLALGVPGAAVVGRRRRLLAVVVVDRVELRVLLTAPVDLQEVVADGEEGPALGRLLLLGQLGASELVPAPGVVAELGQEGLAEGDDRVVTDDRAARRAPRVDLGLFVVVDGEVHAGRVDVGDLRRRRLGLRGVECAGGLLRGEGGRAGRAREVRGRHHVAARQLTRGRGA